MEDIIRIVFGITASISVAGGVVLFVIKLSAEKIAEALENKYTHKLDKQLEKYKKNLEGKVYISKAKFDTEFSIYRELSNSFFDMVRNITIMIPAGFAKYPADKKKREEFENKLYDDAFKSTVIAQDILKTNIPFIPEGIYEQYEEIVDLCRFQLGVFEERWDVLNLESHKDMCTFKSEDYRRSVEIRNKFTELNKELRKYLSTLDVLE